MQGQIIIDADLKGAWLICKGSEIYWLEQDLPIGKATDFDLVGKKAIQIGQWQADDSLSADYPLYLVEPIDDQRTYQSLRNFLYLDKSKFNLLSRGVELQHFLIHHRFCGKCGSQNHFSQTEWAMQCQNPACGNRLYPVICPSIIVAIRKGKQILLANHARHRQSQMYTVLAGFVEVGETFEQAVAREVFEETQIQIKNLRYVGSQPWAFPNAQMVAFLADYESGEIITQPSEIADAQWFNYDNPLPELPPKGTIARQLIETTLDLCKRDNQ